MGEYENRKENRTMKTSIFRTRIIRKGSQVIYRGGWGRDPQKIAQVIAIEQTNAPNEKYGDEVASVHLDDHYVLTLNNGHWCYSYQVDGLVQLPDNESVTK